jgi:hypothetical protein
MAGFDPDAYLKQAAPQQFDPDVYLGGRGTPPSEPPKRTWGQAVKESVGALPGSAGKFVGGLAEIITSPVQTAKGLADVAAGTLRNVMPAGIRSLIDQLDTNPQAAEQASAAARAAGGYFADRLGSPEAIKNTLATDPVGLAADLSMLFSAGAGAVRAVPGATKAGFAAAKAVPAFQNLPQLTTVPQKIAAVAAPTANALEAAARYTNPVQPLVSGVNAMIPVLGGTAQYGAGFATGIGKEPFAEAFAAGKKGAPEFAQHMRGKVSPEQLLDDVKQGLTNMQNEMSAAYATARTGWAADVTPLDFGKIDAAFNRLEATTQHAGKSLVGKEEAAKIAEVRNVLDEWRADPASHNALGFDALKRRIDAIYPDSPKQSQAQRIISGTRNAVKDEIVAQVPEYASAMKGYEESLGLIRDIEKGLSAGDKAAKATALQKLQSLAKGKSADKYRQELISTLERKGGVNLRPSIAGQALSEKLRPGLGSLGAGAGVVTSNIPLAIAGTALSSPRLMGELFYGAGRAAGGANALSSKLGARITPEQINYLNVLMQSQQQGMQ